MNTTLPAGATPQTFLAPVVDITETKDAYILEAEMPGVSQQGLEVQLNGSQLTIAGHRGQPPADMRVLHHESGAADFRRSFELSPGIDAARIEARMDHGVLILNLPKAEKAKPRNIAISE